MKSAATLTYERFGLLTCSHFSITNNYIRHLFSIAQGLLVLCCHPWCSSQQERSAKLFQRFRREMYSYHTKVTQNITMKAFTKALGDPKVRIKQQFV